MIRLLVVGLQPTIRRALLMWLALLADVTIVAEATDILSALWQAAMTRPDVILLHLDTALPDDTKLIAALRRAAPESRIIVLSLNDDVLTRRRILGAGAAAFVSMHDTKDRLLYAIRGNAGTRQDGQTAPSGQVMPARKSGGEL